MRILYSHYLTESTHPAVRMVHHISEELRKFGHEVLIHDAAGASANTQGVSNQSSKTSRKKLQGIRQLLWFLKASNRNRKWFPSDLRRIEEFGPDIVLSRQDAYCWSVAKAARQLGLPMVTYADAPVAYESRMFNSEGRWHPPGLVEWIEKWGLRNSLASIVVSEPSRDRIQRYGLNLPVHVIHNGVERHKYAQALSAEKRLKLRDEFGLHASVVVGFQGTFRAFHGIDRLREIITATAQDKSVQWLLIGDGPERSALREAIGGDADVIFAGRQPPDRMPELLQLMDIAVAPHALMDGDFYFCPLKILEYAASGCAVVASDQGDIPILLENGKAGEIVRSNNSSDWIAAVDGLIRDPARRQTLGASARHYVLENLTWNDTAKKVERVLTFALDKSGTAAQTGHRIASNVANPSNTFDRSEVGTTS